MSKSPIKKIVVAGDAAIDWFLFPVDAQDAGDNWRLRAAMRPTALPGGALLLGDFVREAVTALHADAQVFAPVIPLNLNDIPPEQLIHSNAMLEFFKLVGAEQPVLEEGVSDPFTKCSYGRHGINGRLCEGVW